MHFGSLQLTLTARRALEAVRALNAMASSSSTRGKAGDGWGEKGSSCSTFGKTAEPDYHSAGSFDL